uniref:Voltage-dependent calcium channel alpha-2/delta subunit conserved region domain-containing protein n=1 Tax=Timema poppense TaxID=170557 RepID=A0A7R9D6J2_TIMPO|nr:unnamed protein product [Timema poppensis]
MKRVASEKHNYYYAPLTGTPFTMGIALPEGYGDFTIKVVDTIKTFQQKGINIADYFTGSNWKIHPECAIHPHGLYCKYHHAAHRTFSSLEEELLHFLEKMSSPDWKWSEQYEPLQEEVDPDTWTYLNSNDCKPDKLCPIHLSGGMLAEAWGQNQCAVHPHPLFCAEGDKDLMQLLVFDAQITDPVFRDERWIFRNKEEQELLEIYNVSLRFVATQSGLTRWEHVQENEDSVIKGAEFGDLHKHTIEEAWYKSAVLQHEIEKDSFVFSVPFGADVSFVDELRSAVLIWVSRDYKQWYAFDAPTLRTFDIWYYNAGTQIRPARFQYAAMVIGDRDDILVTGSHAIFPRDGGLEAPGSVVGLQFHHSNMRSRFLSITSKIHVREGCPTCTDTCASEEWECYVIDNNGYVVVSENLNDTGRFFGEIEGAVMEAMKIEKIFRKIPIWDYQALRLDEPLYHLGWLIQWVIGEMIWLFYQTSLLAGGWSSASPFLPVEVIYEDYELGEEFEEDSSREERERMEESSGSHETLTPINSSELSKMPNVTFIVYNESTPCDQKAFLYMLQQNLLPRDGVTYANPGVQHMSGLLCSTVLANQSIAGFLRRISGCTIVSCFERLFILAYVVSRLDLHVVLLQADIRPQKMLPCVEDTWFGGLPYLQPWGRIPEAMPFHLRHIPYSNLVLVVVETLYPTCYRRLSVAPMEVYYNYSKYPCQKVQLNELPRRKRMGCFSDHPQEVDIKMCGDGNVVSLSLAALFLSSLVLTTVQVLGH